MKRFMLAMSAAILALALLGCGRPAANIETKRPQLGGSAEATATIRGLSYRLAVAPSGSGRGVITATVTNHTGAPAISRLVDRVTITSSKGVVILDTYPPGMRTILVGIPLKPGKTYRRTEPFDVPPPGTYTVALPEVVKSDGARPLSVQFEVVR